MKIHKLIPKKFLVNQYCELNKTQQEIGNIIGYSREVIRQALIYNDIDLRNYWGDKIGQRLSGEKHYNYKGGYPYCKICGKILKNINSSLCRDCWKEQKKKNKKLYFCAICNKEISRRSKHCKSCANKISTLNYWKNPDYREKVLKNSKKQGLKITKPEKLTLQLLKILKLSSYKLNIDANVVIGTKIPDFINKKDKKIIEVFGDYWHSDEFVKNHGRFEDTENGRIKYFNKFNYKTLIIWEHELKDLDVVCGKILAFHEN